MRSVVLVGPNELELNYMWLPTWLGMNTKLKAEIEQELSPKLTGMPVDEATLDWAHDQVLLFLEKKFPEIEGLREFLESLKFISDK